MSQPNPNSDLQLDKDGNVILNPLSGWIVGPAAEIAILLALQYKTHESEGAKTAQVQLILTPEQALLLAEKLTTNANRLLTPNPAKPTN